MNKLYITIVLLTILSSCESKTEKFEFTFYKWNIREDYFLKINTSDTLYLIIDNPIEKVTKFTLLKKSEKEEINKIILNLKFPKTEHFSSSVDDGVTYAFAVNSNARLEKVSIHNNSGPAEFWTAGKYLENLKRNHNFETTSRIINLKDIKSVFFLPPPPKIK